LNHCSFGLLNSNRWAIALPSAYEFFFTKPVVPILSKVIMLLPVLCSVDCCMRLCGIALISSPASAFKLNQIFPNFILEITWEELKWPRAILPYSLQASFALFGNRSGYHHAVLTSPSLMNNNDNN
jgi:hypothetical protein